VSELKERIKGRLGDLLPLKYGKSLPAAIRDSAGSVPVYGSSGVVGIHSAALTNGPVIIVGRKGNVGAVHYSAVPCWPIDTAYFAEPPIGHDPRYYRYLLDSLGLARLDKSTAIPGLSRDDYNAVEVVIHPPEQQAAIVAEIEKQFSRLDEAVANLQRVKANLKRYKASVLKDAVEGRLVETEASIAQREGRSYETGEQLLLRILEERRAKWSGKGKYKEPLVPVTEALPILPEGWTWARLDSLAALKGGITVDSKRIDPTARTVPYLRVANVQRGFIDLAEVKQINASSADIQELRLEHGDVLFNEGGDRDKLGRGWIWEGQLGDCIHQNHVFRARMYLGAMSPKLVSWWGNTFGKDYFLRVGKQTTNLASINLGKLSEFPVPVPPQSEQLRMVLEIERLLSVVEEVESAVDANLKCAQAMRQSTLAKCFSRGLDGVSN
jgi:type I restriction enzyme S subunit